MDDSQLQTTGSDWECGLCAALLLTHTHTHTALEMANHRKSWVKSPNPDDSKPSLFPFAGSPYPLSLFSSFHSVSLSFILLSLHLTHSFCLSVSPSTSFILCFFPSIFFLSFYPPPFIVTLPLLLSLHPFPSFSISLAIILSACLYFCSLHSISLHSLPPFCFFPSTPFILTLSLIPFLSFCLSFHLFFSFCLFSHPPPSF